MEDDSELGVLALSRELTKELVERCEDAGLLDLVYKLLLNG